MRSILALAVLAAALAASSGCTKTSAADQIVGTWIVDIDAMKETEGYKQSSDEEKQMAEMMLSNMKMEITFTKADFTVDTEMMGQKSSETKPYTVKSENGKTLVLTSKDDQGMDENVVVVVGADTLTFKVEEDSFELKRKKS